MYKYTFCIQPVCTYIENRIYKNIQVKKQQLKPDMEQQPGTKLGKEYVKGVYCHRAYLTYMQTTS